MPIVLPGLGMGPPQLFDCLLHDLNKSSGIQKVIRISYP